MASVATTFAPLCLIDGKPATVKALLPVATSNYGHISIMQVRDQKVRGLNHHLRRLGEANIALFGRYLDLDRVADFIAGAVEIEPHATLRVNVFAGEAAEHVMVTASPPVEHDPTPARFSLVPFERDAPELKHVGGFGLYRRQRDAIAEGYDGAVFVNRLGEISEATIWNIGFYDGDAVIWPAAHHLRGITQILISEGLAVLGIPVRHQNIRADMLGRYESGFITNSSTFGRPLMAVGTHSFALNTELDELLLRAYEQTYFELIRKNLSN
jgi:branched-subunit amino acid aminotransferase/4-amino-4-deoxychorismate lyase